MTGAGGGVRRGGGGAPHPEACAVPEVLTDDLRLVAAEEDGVADALAGQPPYLVLEDGPAGHLDHRFGPVVREGPEALTFAAGDDEGVHGGLGALCFLLGQGGGATPLFRPF